MGKVVGVTAQGYEQRVSAPGAAKRRTLTRRFAPPSPASRRGAGTVRAPTTPTSGQVRIPKTCGRTPPPSRRGRESRKVRHGWRTAPTRAMDGPRRGGAIPPLGRASGRERVLQYV